jgi:23S rRNA (adenine-N6)-dimethyltransferase
VPGSARSARRERSAWGWYPLREEWARRIVAASGVARGDVVLDVGAGTGAVTVPLLDAGARVIAVELHPQRLAVLRDIATARPRLTVVHADAADLRLPRRPFRVVANPPYAVTSALLTRLLAPGSRLSSAHLVLQRAAAERWADGRAPGAGRWARTFRLRVERVVPRHAFHPPSPVDVALLHIDRR